MHTFAVSVEAYWRIVVVAFLFGAGLPLIFAFGIRFWSADDGTLVGERNSATRVAAYLCFGLVAVAVAVGLLFIARDFIGHQLGISFLGGKK